MGSKKKVTVGYRYYLALHMGFCRGPVDELVQINVGGKEAFGPKRPGGTGHRKETVLDKIKGRRRIKQDIFSPITENLTFLIDAENLFGGEKREGGIEGIFHFLNGEPDQQAPAGLKSLLGGLVPAFRGVCTAYYDGLVTAMNPYPKPWSVRLRRALKGWDNADVWYPAKAKIELENGAIKAMNPAHILLECQTNRDWGRGKHRSLLDLNSYQQCADKLYQEGFGLCLKWRRTDDISRFEDLVLGHIGAVHYLSRTTGLWTLRLIRDDYKQDELPLFEQGTGLLAIDEQQISAADSAANQFIVKWTDPRDGNTRQSRAKNLGAIQQAGGVITTTSDYPGLPTASLAARVAARDCFLSTSNLQKLKIRLDRRGSNLKPGSVFRLNAPARGISDTVFRVGQIDYGKLTQSAIILHCVEDVFTLPDEGVSDTQAPIAPPVSVPEPITLRKLIEPCWFNLACELTAGDLAAVTDEQAALSVLAAKPSDTQRNYTLLTRTGSAPFEEAATGDFCPCAQISQSIPLAASAVTVPLLNPQGWEDVAIGSAALIDDEIMQVSAADLTAQTVTLKRGCADTLPAAHESGTVLWFYQEAACHDDKAYLMNETVQIKLLTRTLDDTLPENLAPVDSLTLSARQHKPYPPGSFKINNAAYPQTITGALSLSWASRNRLLQADQLHDTQVGNITTEENVTYSLRIYGETGALRLSVDGLTGTTYTWPIEAEKTASNLKDSNNQPRLNASLRIELWSVRDGTASQQKHNHTVTRNLP